MKNSSLNTADENNRLASSIKQGDMHAFDILYRKFYAGLVSFATRYIDFEHAEEIVQDTMIWLWEHRDSLNLDMNLNSFLFTIVKNRALNVIKHQSIKSKVHQEICDKYEANFMDIDFYGETELHKLYEDALIKLPETYRTVFVMNREKGMTYEEIAQELNISPKTVGYRISQSLKILRVELRDYLPLLLYSLAIYSNTSNL
ncbi:MAG: RNA polymerase sigma-70 factor [Bacteroidaceae bacterium]